MKPGRIPCDVPGCRRTGDAAKYDRPTRIICAKCWQGNLTRAERAEFRAANKRLDALGLIYADRGYYSRLEYLDDAANRSVVDRIWAKCIESAVGL